jgi:hypothetical protein
MMSLKIPKPGPKYGIGFELPRDRRSRLQDCDRRGGEQIAEMSLNHGVQRLIDIMGDRIEGAAETANLLVRIQGIGIVGIADADGPCQLRGHSPGVLCIEVQVEKVERFVCRVGKVCVAVDATP